MKDANGEPERIPGSLKAVKGIGWYIEEYGIAQLSLNLTDIQTTPVHIAFDEACAKAQERGIRVTGSELVGLLPLRVMTDAADYFLRKQQRSLGISTAEKVKIAVKSLGLDDLGPFDPNKRVIEFMIAADRNTPLLTFPGPSPQRPRRKAGAGRWIGRCLFGNNGRGPGDHGGQPFSAQTRMGRSLGGIQPVASEALLCKISSNCSWTQIRQRSMPSWRLMVCPRAPKRNSKRVMWPFKTPPKTPLKFQCGSPGWRLMR